jgi:predicted phosphate transport protein (TIGR00153 family)
VGLFPRDEQFFPMFSDMARRLTGCAELIAQMFNEPARIDELTTEIKRLEHEADGMTREINLRIDRSIVTPLDREDIHLLAGRLDNVIDLLDGTARRVQMFNIREMRPEAARLADVLRRAAGRIQTAVDNLKKPKLMLEHTAQMKALEEEGDAIYFEAVSALFKGETNPMVVIAWKELFDKLEDAIDECDHVSHVLESIAIKNG